jgi:hypothetical protein
MSKILGLFFKEAFGTNSYDKKIPGFVLNAPVDFKRELVKWYWMGDGCTARHGKRSIKPLAFTSSKDLAYGLIWLLKSMAVDAALRRVNGGGEINGRKIISARPLFVVEVMGGNSLANFREITGMSACTSHSFADTLPAFILDENVKGRNCLTVNNRQLLGRVKPHFRRLFDGDVYFPKVVEVTEEEYSGWLYDVETEYGNFAHSTCVVSHNCSLHAESPEAAIIRMKSPPMDVPEGNLMLISCFVQMGRVRMPDGSMVRRVLEITEVEPKDGRIELKRVFTWNARNDAFTPDEAEAVVKRSYRLGAVKRLTGMTDSELAEEVSRRASYLEKTVEENKLLYPDFTEAIGRFYAARRKGLNEAR